MSRTLPDPTVEPTITVPRAAVIAGVGRRTGYDAVKRGEWPSIHVGRSIRIPTARFLQELGLDAWVEAQSAVAA